MEHVIDEVIGKREPRKSVTGVRILDVNTGDAKELPTHGLFIGHDPATALFRGQLDMDRAGYIKVGSWSTKTSVPGVLAAGDVIDPVFHRAISAAGMGSMAALEAEKFLAEPLVTPAVMHEIEIIGVYAEINSIIGTLSPIHHVSKTHCDLCDLAPNFYRDLSSLQRFWVAAFSAVAAGCGAEPFRLRSTASRRGFMV